MSDFKFPYLSLTQPKLSKSCLYSETFGEILSHSFSEKSFLKSFDPLIAKGTSSAWGSALALRIAFALLLCWNFPFSVPCLFLPYSLIFIEHRGFLRNSEWKETFQRTLRSKILYLHWHLMDNFVKHRIPGEEVLSFRDWRAVPYCLRAFLVAVENSRTALIPDCLWCSVCLFLPFGFQCSQILELLLTGYLPVFLFPFSSPPLHFLWFSWQFLIFIF